MNNKHGITLQNCIILEIMVLNVYACNTCVCVYLDSCKKRSLINMYIRCNKLYNTKSCDKS